ncbi:F-box/kelch-repeat protein, partial [Tanacetum coccineum]
ALLQHQKHEVKGWLGQRDGGVSRVRGGLTPLQSAKVFDPQTGLWWEFLLLAFFVDVGGEVYDPKANVWLDMPTGMDEGWPAKQARTKLSVIVDGDLYALDPSNSLGSAKIKVYGYQDDTWNVVLGGI